MARPKKLKKAEVIEALKQAHGLKSGAAELLGVAYNTIDRYVAADQEARDVIEHWRIRRKDRAEYKLDEAIEKGENWAVMFTLKNAKDREYSEHVDVTSGGEKVVFEIVRAKVPDHVTDPASEASPISGQPSETQSDSSGT